MRLYLLPISTRRTLLYCQKLNPATLEKPTWSDKFQSKAARMWADWEKKESGWQKSVVNYGNYAFRRIPYEEWGLKSVPPLSQRRREVELNGADKVEVVYPGNLLHMTQVSKVLEKLSTERQAIHKQRLIWCIVGMPISAPVALIPLIPNLPFFYLVYRAWSHWRAMNGGKHIQFLLKNNLLSLSPSPILDAVYSKQKFPLPSTPEPTTGSQPGQVENLQLSAEAEAQNPEGETMLLSQENGKKMTQVLDLPQLEVELERAIWQVETAIKAQNAGKASRSEPDSGSIKTSRPEDKKQQ